MRQIANRKSQIVNCFPPRNDSERVARLRGSLLRILRESGRQSERPLDAHETAADRATLTAVNMWDALLLALVETWDGTPVELAEQLSGLLWARVPVVGDVVEDGRVAWRQQNVSQGDLTGHGGLL